LGCFNDLTTLAASEVASVLVCLVGVGFDGSFFGGFGFGGFGFCPEFDVVVANRLERQKGALRVEEAKTRSIRKKRSS
jgi:hypothetical protein